MKHRAAAFTFLLGFSLLVSVSSSHALPQSQGSSRGHQRGRGEEEYGRPGQLEIELGHAQQHLHSEGGSLRVWSEQIDAIRNTRIGVAELELEQNGMLVPHYTDADKIAYVLQGCGIMGAVAPGAQSQFRRIFIRRVQKGDVVALPKGTVYWWYNEGNERHRVLCAGDTTFGVNPGRFHQFGLVGAKRSRFGSLLHGFSHDSLATAWGVDEATVRSLLDKQNEAGIIKVERKIQFPELPRGGRLYHEDMGGRLYEEEIDGENLQYKSMREHTSEGRYFEELKYSIRPEHPDFFVRNGGWLNLVNHHKLPALRRVGFSAMRVFLEENAMCAPSFVRNAHQLLYVTRGGGRIQIASGDGESVFDNEVREGTLLVIPQFFPSVKIAGNQGLEYINLLTSDAPSISFLAGRNSVYRGVPKQVVAAAFNVDEHMLSDLGRDQEIIFPSRSRQGRRGEEEERERERGGRPAWATM